MTNYYLKFDNEFFEIEEFDAPKYGMNKYYYDIPYTTKFEMLEWKNIPINFKYKIKESPLLKFIEDYAKAMCYIGFEIPSEEFELIDEFNGITYKLKSTKIIYVGFDELETYIRSLQIKPSKCFMYSTCFRKRIVIQIIVL
jgi:hypothetical protein